MDTTTEIKLHGSNDNINELIRKIDNGLFSSISSSEIDTIIIALKRLTEGRRKFLRRDYPVARGYKADRYFKRTKGIIAPPRNICPNCGRPI